MKQKLNIALAQKKSEPFAVNKNLQTALSAVALAIEQKADIIIFPEMFMTGYLLGAKVDTLAFSRDDVRLVTLQHAARQGNLAIVIGFPEKDEEGNVYNSLAFIDRDGSIAHVYRKTHLFGDTDRSQFVPGQEIRAFDTSFGRIGMQICYDIEFPETSRLLALDGAQLICAASANMSPYEEVHVLFARVRAMENHVAFAYTNAVGEEGPFHYCGRSSLFDADGNCLTQAGEEEAILFAQVTVGERSEDPNMEYLHNRRADLY